MKFQSPVSITYLMPLIVIDVSAIFVAKMIFLDLGGQGAKAFTCSSGASPAYIGHISI